MIFDLHRHKGRWVTDHHILLADHDILDIARSRAAEQEVLDLLDEPPTR